MPRYLVHFKTDDPDWDEWMLFEAATPEDAIARTPACYYHGGPGSVYLIEELVETRVVYQEVKKGEI